MVLEVPDIDFIRPCGVVVFALFYCSLDMCCVCYVGCLQLSVFISMCLFVLCVLCLTVLVNCLLNVFAICVGEVHVFSLKVMVLFIFLLLLAKPCIVFQRVCVLCLGVCMGDVISEIEGSLAFCALMLFLCSILCLMCSGSSLQVECILPFGMLCLSAWKMMFVKMVFAVCMSGGG